MGGSVADRRSATDFRLGNDDVRCLLHLHLLRRLRGREVVNGGVEEEAPLSLVKQKGRGGGKWSGRKWC